MKWKGRGGADTPTIYWNDAIELSVNAFSIPDPLFVY